jgi:hypothetical protein
MGGESKEVGGDRTHTTPPPSQPTTSDAAQSPMSPRIAIPAHGRGPSLVDSATMVQGDSLVFTQRTPPDTQRRQRSTLCLMAKDVMLRRDPQIVPDQPTINSAALTRSIAALGWYEQDMARRNGATDDKVDH